MGGLMRPVLARYGALLTALSVKPARSSSCHSWVDGADGDCFTATPVWAHRLFVGFMVTGRRLLYRETREPPILVLRGSSMATVRTSPNPQGRMRMARLDCAVSCTPTTLGYLPTCGSRPGSGLRFNQSALLVRRCPRARARVVARCVWRRVGVRNRWMAKGGGDALPSGRCDSRPPAPRHLMAGAACACWLDDC